MTRALNIAIFVLMLSASWRVLADTLAFSNSLARADVAIKQDDLAGALTIYDAAQQAEAGNAASLCELSHRYCDLSRLTNSADVQKDIIARAVACAEQAVKDEPTNAIAHASVAVCYAKACNYADIKTELLYTRLFKEEAQKAIALDPTQDVAYYLLGRWNYALANVGFFSRVYVKIVYGGLPPANMQDAVNNFKKACELAPNRILDHSGLAMAYENLGETKLEIAELQKCCSLKPTGPEDVDAQADAHKKLSALQTNLE